MDKPTQEELDDLLARWQAVLRLQDWDVKVLMSRAHDMPHPDATGTCTPVLARKTALIHLLDPIDYANTQWPQDMEQTLVHELLHLHFAPFHKDTEDSDYVAEEQAIECIATALVGLERK